MNASTLERQLFRDRGTIEALDATDHNSQLAQKPLNSFNSSPYQDDYPAKIDDLAFHGLTGDVVRLIEPHTEADPAALLFQLLTAFGSIIGHDPYILADGSRHHLNLFGVLVGQSSKGRKGTSWNQISTVLNHADQGWCADHVTTGLSSGEGLIWNVRDPISETKPIRQKGRHTGEYETIVTDVGISDKRLLVLEGEFANTLKVMEREANTLSPIIRQAWDCGNLRSLVKNSPAQATGAHISIIGHITRDELKKLLNSTEAANGFANRFCWLAVRRSKCLPEGGRLYSVNFTDLIRRFRVAVEFAEDVGEITRANCARELWREDYPNLSEGRPGLIGAVTGRAEAQVMRLSALYALLDCSASIKAVHHRAAMALWDYCERSAEWIFGRATGDKEADKIFQLLTYAGDAGMTKTEISVQGFSRNLPVARLDAALGLLARSRYAYWTPEKTGGAPVERWFSGSGERI